MTHVIEPICQKTLDELLERESRIERAQRNAYYEIGLELFAIKDKPLYKTPRETPIAGRYSFTTWEEYVSERWEMSQVHADRLIQSATVADKIKPIGLVLPARESHVRELLKLETDDHRAVVWQQVVDSGENITGKTVSDYVERFKANLSKNWLTLEEWEALSDDELSKLAFDSAKTLNKQKDTTAIEWAQWSWNPITGCKHDCPYCYARDIANRFYPQKFEPSIYPERFACPENTTVPDAATNDTAFKNVFTGSMADIFGRWVPADWIERVLKTVSENPQWNFLFLTKFPQRIHEFETPDNAWMGTTVDCQDRVANAEKAFAKMGGGIKWISVEPMLTPIKFTKLDMFDWVVIGESSRSTNTPAWVPPFDWVADLHKQARDADCSIYHKTNLGITDELRLREFPWEETTDRLLPESLKYLNIK